MNNLSTLQEAVFNEGLKWESEGLPQGAFIKSLIHVAADQAAMLVMSVSMDDSHPATTSQSLVAELPKMFAAMFEHQLQEQSDAIHHPDGK